MPTQPFIPNTADAFDDIQASPESEDFEYLLLGHQRTGVISGCAVTESSPTAQTVDVAAGVASLNGNQITVALQEDEAVSAADGSNPRKDLISINSSGSVVVTAGTAAAVPAAPGVPANNIPLFVLLVPTSDNDHEDAQLSDKRVILGPVIDDAIRYVSPNGSDSLDGRTRGTAFASPAQAVTDLAAVTTGAKIVIAVGQYDVGAGITSDIPGLVVIGEGHRNLTPVTPGDAGVVLFSTTSSAWLWTFDNPDKATLNEYEGSRIENIQFLGDSTTAGGLRIFVNNMTVVNCSFLVHTTGTGFLQIADGAGADDAAWLYIESCIAQDCLIGYDFNNGFQWVSNITLNTTNGGIIDTGTGAIVRAPGTLLGGKFEENGIGLDIQASDGVMALGVSFENCPTGVALTRSSQAFSSRIKLIGLIIGTATTPINVGAEQEDDVIVACHAANGGSNVDDGTNTQWIASGGDPFYDIKGQSGDEVFRFFTAGAEIGHLQLGSDGLTWDMTPVTNGGYIIQLGGTTSSAQYRIRDSASAELFRVHGNGVVDINQGPIELGASPVEIVDGTGSPEGGISANVGSIFLRDDGALGTSFYYKASGTGSTGWRPVGTGAKEESGAFTLDWEDSVVNVDSSGGAVVVTIPDAAAFAGKNWLVRRDGSNTVTLNRSGSDTFDDGDIQKTLDSDSAAIGFFTIGDTELKIVGTEGTVGGS